MFDLQRNNGAVESLLRRKVKSPNPNDLSKAPFSRLEQSAADYVPTLVHLIVLLLRSLDSDRLDGDEADLLSRLVPLDESLRRHLQSLWGGLQTEDEDGRFPDNQVGMCKAGCMDILESLFFIERPSHRVPEASSLVYRFVVFATIPVDHVVTPDQVTHRISRLMYWCRSLVLYKIVCSPDLEVEDVDGVEDRFLRFVRDSYRTPFAGITEAKRQIFAITKNDLPLPKVLWTGDAQIVHGIPMDIAGISTMVSKTIKVLYKELRRDLLFNMPAYNANAKSLLESKSGGGLEDNLGDNRSRYSFVWDRNNQCSGYTLDLVNHIVSDDALRRKFVDRTKGDDGKINWNPGALANWLQKVRRWLQKLLAVAHLTAGQPGRGVEFLTTNMCNTSIQIRGVYFIDGLVMLLSLYGKADNLRGAQRPVARFLCKDTSYLLVSYLTYIREMEIIASTVLYDKEQTALYGYLLGVKEGRKLETRDLSEGIAGMFLTHLKVYATVKSWRHMASAWMHRFLGYTNVSALTHNGPLDSQAGHSQQIATMVYGRSNFDHPSIGREEFQLFWKVSVEWHKLLHLNTQGPPPCQIVGTRQALLDQNSGAGASASAVTNVHHHHHHHRIQVVRSVGDVGIDFPSLACSESALRGLLALGYDKFKSSHQARAIHRVLMREEDLLVVLPTGGGKTLLFLLPAVVESGRFTTVVICPFVALRNDLVQRLWNANVSVQVYSQSVGIGDVDILLVSVEQCMSEALQNGLAHLHDGGRLGRIVVDECHVAVTASLWRQAVREMEHVRRVPVPLLLLSATVPPTMEDQLKAFFVSQLAIVRSPTTRSNICYKVMKDGRPVNDTLSTVLLSKPSAPKSIIFLRGREQTRHLAEALCAHGFLAVHYHGGLDEPTRTASQTSWMRGDADIMVATGAFGAGIDFGAVRLVVHMDEPYSMIDLAQESGRAGRDGLPSEHIVILPGHWQTKAETCPRMQEFLSGMKCRRWVLQEYLDGCGIDCFSSGCDRCDVCESVATRVRTANSPPTQGSDTNAHDLFNLDMDLFDDAGEEAFAMTEERPTKRMCMADALLSDAATESHEGLASQSLVSLNLVQFLRGAADKCILCTLDGEQHGWHAMTKCPYVRRLCFKCLASTHGSTKCTNRLMWREGHCFGCGLPNSLWQQLLHPQNFGTNCASMGDDKIVPACWFFWRNPDKFMGILRTAGCPLDMDDRGFSEWLTSPNQDYKANAIHLLIVYVNTLERERA
jgi:hypothetical protein